MIENPSEEMNAQKTTQVDAEFYKRLCEVVKAGQFIGIHFSPWHKGCDTELDATCDWPTLQDDMEAWYYDNIGDFETHTTLFLYPAFKDSNLFFEIDTQWNRSFDQFSELSKDWCEEEIQEMVYVSLPDSTQRQTTSDDILLSLSLEYQEPDKLVDSEFCITQFGNKMKRLTALIKSQKRKQLARHILDWCQKTHGPQNNFSITVENNEISCVVSSGPSEKYLVIPKKVEDQ